MKASGVFKIKNTVHLNLKKTYGAEISTLRTPLKPSSKASVNLQKGLKQLYKVFKELNQIKQELNILMGLKSQRRWQRRLFTQPMIRTLKNRKTPRLSDTVRIIDTIDPGWYLQLINEQHDYADVERFEQLSKSVKTLEQKYNRYLKQITMDLKKSETQ